MVAFAIYWHELATDVHVSLHPKPRSHLPPHPIPLGCPSVQGLKAPGIIETTVCMVSTPLDCEILAPCFTSLDFISLDMFQ